MADEIEVWLAWDLTNPPVRDLISVSTTQEGARQACADRAFTVSGFVKTADSAKTMMLTWIPGDDYNAVTTDLMYCVESWTAYEGAAPMSRPRVEREEQAAPPVDTHRYGDAEFFACLQRQERQFERLATALERIAGMSTVTMRMDNHP